MGLFLNNRGGVAGQQYDVPLAHYQGIYEKADPLEIAERCGLSFEKTGEEEGFFPIRLMGTGYRAVFPVFELRSVREDVIVSNPAEKILLIRYLCEGKFFERKNFENKGKQLSYNEVPSGPLYYRNFDGRCLKRAARTFGNDLTMFRRAVEEYPGLRFEALDKGDAGHAAYRIEFLSGLFIHLLIWAGDDEFQPSAQILFDDNLVFAFTAEDLAVVGEVLIARLKKQEEFLTAKYTK
ncbi:hypothetical protein FACS1894151_03760 [Spirochaetia bacterium]|nr:hypothetical protein FACS1894151_03760 [Spirochaetia bacterium]